MIMDFHYTRIQIYIHVASQINSKSLGLFNLYLPVDTMAILVPRPCSHRTSESCLKKDYKRTEIIKKYI